MRNLLVFIFSLFVLYSPAQNTQKIDSLMINLQRAEEIGNSKEIAFICINIGTSHQNLNAYDKAIEFYTKSLKSYEKLKNKKGISNCYNNLGIVYYSQNDYDKAIEYYMRSMQLRIELDDKEGLSASYTNIGVIHRNLSDYDKAIEYYLKSLKIYEELRDKNGMSNCYNNLGIVHKDLGDYDKAIEYSIKSLELRKELGDKKGISDCYNNIGLIHNKLDNFHEAIDCFKRSLKIKEELGNKNGMAGSYNNLGIVYKNLGDYDKAIEYYLKSQKIYKELENKKGIAKNYNNIGMVYLEQNKYDKAVVYSKKSLKIKEELKDKNGIALTLTFIAELNIKMKKYIKAIEYAKKSLDISKRINALSLQKDGYKILSIANDSLKNYKNAFKYHQLYKQLNDSIFNENSSKQIAETLTKYETEKKEKENELLRKDNEIQMLALEKQTTLRNFFIVLSAFVMLLVFFTFYRFQRKKKANLILAEKNDLITMQKEQLAATLVQLEKANATKDKFFRIIHHDLVNPFTAIYSTADLLYNYYDSHTEDKRKEYLKFMLTGSNKFLNLMNNLFEWVKSQTGTLEFKPESLKLLNIVESELEVLKITANKKEINITLDIQDDNTSVFADRNLLSVIFRNLVSNAIKFTYNKGNVSIKSRKLDEYIEIEIADTGIGIDPKCIEKIFDVDSKLTTKGTNNEEGTGFGLALCKEFVEINNGKIRVESKLGEGSRFIFSIPSDNQK